MLSLLLRLLVACPVDALGHDWGRVLPPKTVSLFPAPAGRAYPRRGVSSIVRTGFTPTICYVAGFGFRGFCVPLASATPGSGNTLTPSQGVVLL